MYKRKEDCKSKLSDCVVIINNLIKPQNAETEVIMLQKYPKKLLKGLLYIVFILLLWVLLSGVLSTIIAIVTQDPTLKSILIMIVPMVIVSVFTYKRRVNFQDMRREYVTELDGRTPTVMERIVYVIKSADFICELLAFLTLFMPLILITLVMSPANLLTMLIAVIFFALCDIPTWYFVYRSWEKERIH